MSTPLPSSPPPPYRPPVLAARPGIIPLRPLGVGDVLGGAFTAIRHNPAVFLGLTVLVSASVVVLAAVIIGIVAAIAWALGDTTGLGAAIGVGAGLAALVGIVLMLGLGQVLSGMLAYAVGEATLGRRPALGEVVRRSRRRVLPLTGLAILLALPSVLLGGGVVALVALAITQRSIALGVVAAVLGLVVLLGLWALSVKLLLACPALVLEDLGVVAALRRSWALTQGRFWRTLGISFLANAASSAVAQVLSTVVQLGLMALSFVVLAAASQTESTAADVASAIGTLLSTAVSMLVTTPFLAAVYALLYIDARIRGEGFDLVLQRAATTTAAHPDDPLAASRQAPLA